MTTTLQVEQRPPAPGRAGTASGPAAATTAETTTAETTTGTFTITFGIAFAVMYTVFERLDWPLFTYHPVSGNVDFWRQPAGVGPPMFWYGWIVLAGAAALAVALVATLASRRLLHRATLFLCVLAALWPAALAALRIFIARWATFDADFLNSPSLAAVPAVVGAAVITWLAGARLSERMWTSLLLIAPIGGLVVLGYSLQSYFVR